MPRSIHPKSSDSSSSLEEELDEGVKIGPNENSNRIIYKYVSLCSIHNYSTTISTLTQSTQITGFLFTQYSEFSPIPPGQLDHYPLKAGYERIIFNISGHYGELYKLCYSVIIKNSKHGDIHLACSEGLGDHWRVMIFRPNSN